MWKWCIILGSLAQNPMISSVSRFGSMEEMRKRSIPSTSTSARSRSDEALAGRGRSRPY